MKPVTVCYHEGPGPASHSERVLLSPGDKLSIALVKDLFGLSVVQLTDAHGGNPAAVPFGLDGDSKVSFREGEVIHITGKKIGNSGNSSERSRQSGFAGLSSKGSAHSRGVRKSFADLEGVAWNNAWKQTCSEDGSVPLMSKLMAGEFYERPVSKLSCRWPHQTLDNQAKVPLVQSLLEGCYYGDGRLALERSKPAQSRINYIARNKVATKKFSEYMAQQKHQMELEQQSISNSRPLSRLTVVSKEERQPGESRSSRQFERAREYLRAVSATPSMRARPISITPSIKTRHDE